MTFYNLAMIGFGNVGQGLAEILIVRGETIAQEFGTTLRIVAICDQMRGSVYAPDGLCIQEALNCVRDSRSLESMSVPYKQFDAFQMIDQSNAHALLELSFTDLISGEPATQHVFRALAQDKHVFTTNKGPVALNYSRIVKEARRRGLYFGIEGTVMSGTPALRLGDSMLSSAGITRIRGILNGTTNFILAKMSDGEDYRSALKQAQSLGYAEADPSGDIDGIDAAGKVVILANQLLGADLRMSDVETQGIRNITRQNIENARQAGKCLKPLGEIRIHGSEIIAFVGPEAISKDDPLASIGGAVNAITYTTDLLGDVTLVGPGAGRTETGYAVLADILCHLREAESGMREKGRNVT